MRWIRHILVLIVVLIASVVLSRSLPPEPALTDSEPKQVYGESDQSNKYIDLETSQGSTRIRWFKVDNTSSLLFIPNYEKFSPSVDVIENNQCTRLVNGGFYDIDDTSVGLVIADGEELYPYEKNSLINGILSINDFGTPRITRSFPSGRIVNAVQTGPLLWENGRELTLRLETDKTARRIFAAVTGSNELYFFVAYDAQSAFNGPLLAELPHIATEINNKLAINIADAVNLDGGSASIFVDSETSLSELTPVGSFWCVK